jgi:hypothetical protein
MPPTGFAMTTILRTLLLSFSLAIIVPAVVAPDVAFAQGKGKGHGGGKGADRGGHGNDQGEDHGNRHRGGHAEGPGGGPYVDVDINFIDVDRHTIYDYYGVVAHSGKCPPGLAKKHNGCLPPGQAKKWVIGRPLPREVIYYDLPPELVVRISPPPAGYRYVRVASDILMIAAGTGMVAAAIEDLARY